ncbi:hypothetical protein [Intestinimonas sp. MSJ-38]|uniref:hypothetical protein n=1 Tax=Intestinimonas sp. MSJ-38 TaxID=2841532 RepID=UPI001C120FCC|nr:hypothetical protein [Intestinimonas sp. MSJ-38]MBU5431413.1 hypothetical protein [Intestinimonas sp. MSJ-38]
MTVDKNGVVILVCQIQFHISHRHIRAQQNTGGANIQFASRITVSCNGDSLIDDKRRVFHRLHIDKAFALDYNGVAILGLFQRCLKAGVGLAV